MTFGFESIYFIADINFGIINDGLKLFNFHFEFSDWLLEI